MKQLELPDNMKNHFISEAMNNEAKNLEHFKERDHVNTHNNYNFKRGSKKSNADEYDNLR